MSYSAKNVEIKLTNLIDQDIEKMIKQFSKKVKKTGILEEVIDRRYFVSKSRKKYKKNQKRKYIIELENLERKKQGNK